MIKSKQNLTFLCLPGFLVLSVTSLRAETDIEQATRFLQQAQESRAKNLRLAAIEAGEADISVNEALLNSAKATDKKINNDATISLAGEKLKQAMSTASPEAKILIAQSNVGAQTAAPSPDRVVPKEQVSIVDITKAKPQPLRPTTLEPEGKKKASNSATVITASGAAFFDSKESIGVFTEDVVVKDPRFHITCDVLEVFMKKNPQAEEASSSAGKPDAQPVPAADSAEFENGDIDRAIAKGRKVVIQKLNEEGKLQIGICRHATYDGSTGDIILRDFPQVQSDTRSATATDRSTVITLKRNGQFEVKGPHTTVLGKPTESKDSGPAAPPAAN